MLYGWGYGVAYSSCISYVLLVLIDTLLICYSVIPFPVLYCNLLCICACFSDAIWWLLACNIVIRQLAKFSIYVCKCIWQSCCSVQWFQWESCRCGTLYWVLAYWFRLLGTWDLAMCSIVAMRLLYKYVRDSLVPSQAFKLNLRVPCNASVCYSNCLIVYSVSASVP